MSSDPGNFFPGGSPPENSAGRRAEKKRLASGESPRQSRTGGKRPRPSRGTKVKPPGLFTERILLYLRKYVFSSTDNKFFSSMPGKFDVVFSHERLPSYQKWFQFIELHYVPDYVSYKQRFSSPAIYSHLQQYSCHSIYIEQNLFNIYMHIGSRACASAACFVSNCT